MGKKSNKKKDTTKSQTQTPEQQKPKADSSHADRLFKTVSDMEVVTEKEVNNGWGLWVGNTRILKKAKTGFPASDLLFPKPPVKTEVADGTLTGTITGKNVAQVTVTEKNYDHLLGGIKTAIGNAQRAVKEREEKKAKREAGAKKTSAAKEQREKAAEKAEQKQSSAA